MINDFDVISALFIILFLIPITIGLIRGFKVNKAVLSLDKLTGTIEFAISLYVAAYLTRKIFYEHDTNFFSMIYYLMPNFLINLFQESIILGYLVCIPVFTVVFLSLIKLLSIPSLKLFKKNIYSPICERLENSKGFIRRVAGLIWNVPKAIILVISLAFVFNFIAYYYNDIGLSKKLNKSFIYKDLYDLAVKPVINSNLSKNLPIILKTSFDYASINVPNNLKAKKRDVIVIEYFNGVTLDEAIKSTPQIDSMVLELIETAQTDSEKAKRIYDWIVENIEYDKNKALKMSQNPKNINSGTIEAFNSKKGICFDYSALFISMTRVAGVKVRLVTGLGYSGVSWGDHSWNQFYSDEESRWVNVDPTFGTIGAYFDNKDFDFDHKFPEIQGEW